MKKRVSALSALVLLTAAVLLLPGRLAGEAQLQEPTAIIDPALLEALEHENEVRVLISLKPPAIPLAEQTTEVMRQHTAERQASVLSVLTDSEFSLIYQYKIAPALSGRITDSGVQKLATHPDVLAVTMSVRGSWDLTESVPLINADQTRFIGIDGTGVDVAVLDSGIDTNHPT